MIKIVKRVLAVLIVAALLLMGCFVLAVGPWPLYTDARYQQAGYFKNALAAIDAAAQTITNAPAAPLQAGWAEREITPAPGHPMAGYGGRPNGKRSTGVREPLFVRALALHDGANTVVLVGSDMLQTLPNLLDMVEARLAKEGLLRNRNIMYTSSHTHCGPGGLAPGFAAKMSYGEFDPPYLDRLAGQFADAITEAVRNMAPARFAHGVVDAPEYIRNRTRKHGGVDAAMHIAVAERKEDGQRLYLARYSAHGTVYSEEVLAFNNDYAGAFQRQVKERTGMPLLFMGGAVGSMRPNPPGPPMPEPWTPELELAFEHDPESQLVRQGKKTQEDWLRDQAMRVEAMGAALADRLLTAAASLSFEDQISLAAIDAPFAPPPAQVRLFSSKWRLSPFVFTLLGVPRQGRLQAARIGGMFLIGLPYDVSGEISLAWQHWAQEHGAQLWVTSFSGAYLGYLSPDKYYHEMGEGLHYNQNYEIGQMNWFGPNQEAFAADLFRHAFQRLTPAG